MGMQVVGAEEVTRVVCAVSASRELFERAAEAGAQLVLVHHGLFWDNEPRAIDTRMKGRLEAKVVDRKPLVFADGPERVRRAAIISGGGASRLPQAAAESYNVLVTGEANEPTMMAGRELGIHVVAAGHYATERLGVQALAARIAERFGVDWEFVELVNPV